MMSAGKTSGLPNPDSYLSNPFCLQDAAGCHLANVAHDKASRPSGISLKVKALSFQHLSWEIHRDTNNGDLWIQWDNLAGGFYRWSYDPMEWWQAARQMWQNHVLVQYMIQLRILVQDWGLQSLTISSKIWKSIGYRKYKATGTCETKASVGGFLSHGTYPQSYPQSSMFFAVWNKPSSSWGTKT